MAQADQTPPEREPIALRDIAADAAIAFVVSLAVALVLGSASAAGVVTMTLARIFLACAWLIGLWVPVLLARYWRTTRGHKAIYAALLALFLFGVERFEALNQPKPPRMYTPSEYADAVWKKQPQPKTVAPTSSAPSVPAIAAPPSPGTTVLREPRPTAIPSPEPGKADAVTMTAQPSTVNDQDTKPTPSVPKEPSAYLTCWLRKQDEIKAMTVVEHNAMVAIKDWNDHHNDELMYAYYKAWTTEAEGFLRSYADVLPGALEQFKATRSKGGGHTFLLIHDKARHLVGDIDIKRAMILSASNTYVTSRCPTPEPGDPTVDFKPIDIN